MALQIGHARLKSLQVLGLEVFLLDATVHLECADCGNQHHAIGREPGLPAFDIDEFLAAEIGAKTGFGNHIVGEFERGRGRQHRIAAVCNIGERAPVNEGRRALQRLHQIGRDRLLEQRGHGAMRLEVASAHGLSVACIADNDIAEAFLEIVEILGKAENRHDFRGNRDIETGFARVAVGNAAERADDLAQCAVVHIHDATPDHAT